MKLIFTVFVFFSCFFFLRFDSSANTFDKGTGTFAFGAGPAQSYYAHRFGPAGSINLLYRHGIWKAGPGVISLGGEFGVSMYRGKEWYGIPGLGGGNIKYTHINFRPAVIAAYHYDWGVEKLDTYAGFSTGIGIRTIIKEEDIYPDTGLKSVFYSSGPYAGASWYLKPGIGAFAEFSYYRLNLFMAGLVLKFN